jgi:hypothetical protein
MLDCYLKPCASIHIVFLPMPHNPLGTIVTSCYLLLLAAAAAIAASYPIVLPHDQLLNDAWLQCWEWFGMPGYSF